MELFKIEDGIVKPTEYILGIYPFDKIWERDKTKKKENAIKDFTFIEYFTSPKKNNPFKDINEEEREQKIIENIRILKKYKPDELVYKAIDKYKEILYQWSYNYRFLVAARKAVDNLKDFLNSVDLNERDDKGRPIYKPKELTSALKDVDQILINLQNLEKKVFEDLTSEKVFGNKTVSEFEDPRTMEKIIQNKQ